ncbi:MAG TPA: serine protease [Ignavibacteriaceae bacterium]
MEKRNLISFICLIISFFILTGCSSVTYEKIYPTLQDGKYDSEFPYKSTSEELTKISETLQRVNSTAFYKIYTFHENDRITLNELKGKELNKIASNEAFADNSSSGTAITVFSQNGNVALLTCAHIITFPDTILAYKYDEFGFATKYIESISIKEKQVIYIAGFPEGSQVEVLAKDDHSDIALLGKKYRTQDGVFLPAFNYPIGKAKEAEWGTFVYLVGYPINFKMITKAIVSSPRRDDDGSFLVDAVINPGFSGGFVLAIRDGVPNFEFIGMVQWVPEEDESLIYPENLKTKATYNPVVPYNGKLYVRKHSSIRYGIAKVIPVESIMTFLLQNKSYLNDRGYFIFEK